MVHPQGEKCYQAQPVESEEIWQEANREEKTPQPTNKTQPNKQGFTRQMPLCANLKLLCSATTHQEPTSPSASLLGSTGGFPGFSCCSDHCPLCTGGGSQQPVRTPAFWGQQHKGQFNSAPTWLLWFQKPCSAGISWVSNWRGTKTNPQPKQ